MALDFSSSFTRYYAYIHLLGIEIDEERDTRRYMVEIVAGSEATAEANAQAVATLLDKITALRIESVTVGGQIVGITGGNTPAFGHFREYITLLNVVTTGGKKTHIKIPAPIDAVLMTGDKRFVDQTKAEIAQFLALFKSPGNLATLRGEALSEIKVAYIKHQPSRDGRIRIG
jgi:hypothetical protein